MEVSEIWIDDKGRLFVRAADESLKLTHIHRASASGVSWDAETRAVCSPVPRDWAHADWFVRIVEDARSEYGVDLIVVESTLWRGITPESRAAISAARSEMPPFVREVVDDRTMAGYVGDDRLREEARELFVKKQWTAVVEKLEALRYPRFMDRSDTRRLEIARKRSRVE